MDLPGGDPEPGRETPGPPTSPSGSNGCASPTFWSLFAERLCGRSLSRFRFIPTLAALTISYCPNNQRSPRVACPGAAQASTEREKETHLMTNDCSSIPPQARKRRTFAVSLSASFVALAGVGTAILALGGPPPEATVYTGTNGSLPFNWSTTTRRS